MTYLSRRLFLAAPAAALYAQAPSPAPAPLFRDPIYDGASDSVVIWNRLETNRRLLYTQRRANVDGLVVFHFTHPGRIPGAPPPPREVHDVEPYALRRTSIQVAKLESDGTEIVCRRDEPFPFRLQPAVDNWTR